MLTTETSSSALLQLPPPPPLPPSLVALASSTAEMSIAANEGESNPCGLCLADDAGILPACDLCNAVVCNTCFDNLPTLCAWCRTGFARRRAIRGDRRWLVHRLVLAIDDWWLCWYKEHRIKLQPTMEGLVRRMGFYIALFALFVVVAVLKLNKDMDWFNERLAYFVHPSYCNTRMNTSEMPHQVYNDCVKMRSRLVWHWLTRIDISLLVVGFWLLTISLQWNHLHHRQERKEFFMLSVFYSLILLCVFIAYLVYVD
jgi:hypothetical protein